MRSQKMAGALLFIMLFGSTSAIRGQEQSPDITIRETSFYFKGKPFTYTGLSFFNAVYNPAFNKDDAARRKWLEKLRDHGINVLRVWAQWDNARGFIDACPTCTFYEKDGSLKREPVDKLKKLITVANDLDMVVLFVLFQRESWNENIRLSDQASDKAVRLMTEELKPFRNVILQIWNEFDHRTVDYLKIIKSIDPARLVTNSPGYGGDLGSTEENNALDFLSPHTTRTDDRQWEIAPKEIAYLLARFRKPVVDDEPARRGTPKFGGPKRTTTPFDHILRIYNVWKAGGYVIYHHDMFQTGYGSEAIPPEGIPDPEFNEYHGTVFKFLEERERYFHLARASGL